MSVPIRTVRISVDAKDQLIRLKRYTRIEQWNILCRWALCRSLAEEHPPSPAPLPPMSNVEMSWPVFAGHHSHAILALVRQRCHEDGLPIDDVSMAEQFRLHLHRGIAYLASEDIRSIEDLVERGLESYGPVEAAPGS